MRQCFERSADVCIDRLVDLAPRFWLCFKISILVPAKAVVTFLFTKLPGQDTAKGFCRSLNQVATCLPHTVEASHYPCLCRTSSRKTVHKVFRLIRLEIKLRGFCWPILLYILLLHNKLHVRTA